MFKSKPIPQPTAKENERVLKKSTQALEREKAKLEKEEKSALAQVKKLAEAGRHAEAKAFATGIARNRQ